MDTYGIHRWVADARGEMKREVSIFKCILRARCTSAAFRNTPSYSPTLEDRRNEEYPSQRSLYDRYTETGNILRSRVNAIRGIREARNSYLDAGGITVTHV